MKNILIICRSFAPDSIIGAKRISMFAKYLSMNGYDVTVIRSGAIKGKPDQTTLLMPNENLHFISYNGINCAAEKYERGEEIVNTKKEGDKNQNTKGLKKFINKHFRLLKKAYTFLFYYYDNYQVYVKAKQEMIKVLRNKQIDIVLTTYSPLGTTLCGMLAKKKYGLKWVMDVRDLMDNVGRTPLTRRINRIIQRKCSKLADVITTPTKGFAEELSGICKDPSKVHVLYNGYEKEIKSADKKKDMLQFCYTGTIHDDLCSLEPLFRAINDLVKEGKVKYDKVCIKYAGKNSDRFMKMAKESQIEQCCYDMGYLSYGESVKLQTESDLFVIMVMNLHDYKGVLSGKLCESIQSHVPALGLVGGDEPDSELRNTINRFNLGFCHEMACTKNQYPELKEYIYNQYFRKMQGQNVAYNPSPECYEEFKYENQIKKIIEIIEGV